ncbi:MAG: Cell division protein FtsZ [Candidatus Uhrbacteria bacterium GW2011_GWD2_41_121]|uniref:Cell division protein FtsZ n=1 Tax=Candidatus Uhrbacteria bacterium GW2011_GWC1_41_20 TaxID=1618983 RepID=A0A0G0VHL4_9BACT|nr:MAG: Cell division protein FtsZ [Candidatus Uhrbacteria bacterium GW2011_GWE1_39_46]KKR64018.1 MAG: Cell division protein FtsZ [Candidatus Uhrbacteria bacterium GW2011_GWC2_40_450]KKR90122.1 MAG: Cell division protein FtsZ [Candidatus Uhrbacteria bacterium GW2011_GWD2_41_121]KKR96078.1 MAG: Cell division protein FtsZ [Candidatus Uhrbacteria bacterium GW2011_GWD1_41_16]KKR99111.1 MAG: cell division protein FtsZ, cell division protein FtsZ [Candidatus Uhrbacteria bacterium GW2011_GWC1_41_20]K
MIKISIHPMAQVKPEVETFAKIKVFGIGGAGGAALNRMIVEKLKGVNFVAINTDVQALHQNLAKDKLAIGKTVTRGLGAGMNPETGRRAAEESANDVRSIIAGTDMVFLTAGLGGGTGSGAIPEIAKIAREAGALTVAVVTKPFSFEGAQRKRIADDAYHELAENVDTIITIPNDRILQIIDKKTSLLESFAIIDDVLRQGVQGISEIITLPGLINVDFADVKAIMQNAGSALMGIGSASGDNRAVEAAKTAIASPLLELSIDGAKGILFTVTGSPDLSMYEVAEAAKVITGSADDDARVIFGANIDESLTDEVRITVVATGFDNRKQRNAPTLAGDMEVSPKGSWKAPEREDRMYSAPKKESPFEQHRVSSGNGPSTAPRPVEQKSVSFNQEPVRDDSSDDEDLGIPAFIRRKMM